MALHRRNGPFFFQKKLYSLSQKDEIRTVANQELVPKPTEAREWDENPSIPVPHQSPLSLTLLFSPPPHPVPSPLPACLPSPPLLPYPDPSLFSHPSHTPSSRLERRVCYRCFLIPTFEGSSRPTFTPGRFTYRRNLNCRPGATASPGGTKFCVEFCAGEPRTSGPAVRGPGAGPENTSFYLPK